MGHLTIVRDDDPASDLTDRQREVLDFISGSISKCGYPPTLREIGSHFGIRSTNGVNDHLRALEKKGYLQREDLKSRALRPLLSTGQTMDVPILGKVAAGQPLLAVRNYEDTVKVDRFFIGQSRGDYVVVRKQLQADVGETVVVMIGDEATVKRYYPEGDSIRFQPANAAMEPIVVRKRDFRSVNLLGVVIGVYRKLH